MRSSHWLIAFVPLLSLAGCSDGATASRESDVEQLSGRVQELEAQLEAAQSAASQVKSDAEALESASEELSSDVSRFD